MFENFRDRTNNKLEGFHNGLNYNQPDHPNVYALISTLRELQLSNEQLVESMDNGSNPPTNPRPKYVRIDQKLQQYTDRLINGEITRLAFFKKVASKLKQAS